MLSGNVTNYWNNKQTKQVSALGQLLLKLFAVLRWCLVVVFVVCFSVVFCDMLCNCFNVSYNSLWFL